MTRERRSSLAVQATAGVAHAIAHMFVLLFATVVLVLEREWAMGYDSLFALSIPMSVLFGAAALPAGWLADRWSPTGMIGVYFFGLGAATVLTGLADGPLGLLAGLSAMGLFAAIYHPVGIPWLISHAPQRGRALGVNGVFGSAGMAAAALVAGGLSAVFGWRAAFIVPGALCLGCGVAFVIACRAGWIGGRAEPLPEETAPPANAMRRVFSVLAVTMLCAGMIYQTTAFALPKIFDERLGVWLDGNVLGIGGLVTSVYLASSLAQVFGGELADRYSLRGVYTATQFLQVPVLAVALVLFEPALVAAATLMVALNVAGQPAENALLARFTPAEWRGRAFGVKFVLTLGVSALGVASIPIAYRLTGSLDVLFVLMAGFAATAGAAAFCLPRAAAPARAAAVTAVTAVRATR